MSGVRRRDPLRRSRRHHQFSFLRGASHPEELVGQAYAIGHAGIGIADRNSLAGVVRAYSFVKERIPAEAGFRLAVGTRLVFSDGTPDILAYPQDREAYGRLTRLLTLGNRRTDKGKCDIALPDLLDHAAGFQMILTDRATGDDAPAASPDWRRSSGACATPARPAVARRDAPLRPGSQAPPRRARRPGAGDGRAPPRHQRRDDAPPRPAPARRCRDLHPRAHDAGRGRPPPRRQCRRHLKPVDEMARIFAETPEAVGEPSRFLDGLSFSLAQLRYDYPYELRQGYATEQEALEALGRGRPR